MNIVDKAHTFARNKHKRQQYSDKAFIMHPAQVSRVIKLLCPLDYELQAAAMLHDILENTDVTPAQLTEEFGADVAGLVFEVTKTGYNQFPNLLTRRGIVLKFADRLCNLVHMTRWTDEKQQAYIIKSKFWNSQEVILYGNEEMSEMRTHT